MKLIIRPYLYQVFDATCFSIVTLVFSFLTGSWIFSVEWFYLTSFQNLWCLLRSVEWYWKLFEAVFRCLVQFYISWHSANTFGPGIWLGCGQCADVIKSTLKYANLHWEQNPFCYYLLSTPMLMHQFFVSYITLAVINIMFSRMTPTLRINSPLSRVVQRTLRFSIGDRHQSSATSPLVVLCNTLHRVVNFHDWCQCRARLVHNSCSTVTRCTVL